MIRPIGDLLGSVLRRAGLEPANDNWRVVEAWARSVGEKVARHAEPLRLEGDELVVAVEDAVWRQELSLLAPDLVARLNGELGRPLVRRLRLTNGTSRPAIAPPQIGSRRRSLARLDLEAPDALAAAESCTSEPIRTALARLKNSMQARVQRDQALDHNPKRKKT